MYYTFNEDKNGNIEWNRPIRSESKGLPRIPIAHDETTFRSGEITTKRWFNPQNAPFFNKGRGVSYMVSDFIVNFPGETYFTLDSDEWNNAIREYPELVNDPKFFPMSATAAIHPKKNNYFDNEIILDQFERLFKLIKFKEAWKNHRIEVLVDNSRNHSALNVDINSFGKGRGTRCDIDVLEWEDEDGNKKYLSCYDEEGKIM